MGKLKIKKREFSHCVSRNYKQMYVDDTMIQSNLVNTDTEWGIESVRINGVSLLNGLREKIREKMWGTFFPRGQSNSL